MDLYHTRKFRKCKYCEKNVKRNITKNGRNKGFYRTCGEVDCLQKQYKDPLVNNKKRHVGESHPRWIKERNDKIRKDGYEWRILRETVFARDKFKCQICGEKEKKLHIDHIKPWKFYPELRWDLNNVRTLCEDCHRKTPTWGKRKIL